MKRAGIIAAPVLVAAYIYWSGIRDSYHVVGPFYVMAIKERQDMALFRCPISHSDACAGAEGFPDATVFAAGGDDHYVVVASHPRTGGVADKSVTQYFYFARIPQEFRGWGLHPEKIIGPLTQEAFEADKSRLHLPGFSITLDDLK